MKREQVIEVFDKHCTLVNTNYIEYIILSKSKFIDAILKLFEQEDYIPVMNRPDWDKPLFEQKESKTAITVLRDKFIEKHIINEYTDDSWMHYDDMQAALEAMEEYRQQPQKEQEEESMNSLKDEIIHYQIWADNFRHEYGEDKSCMQLVNAYFEKVNLKP